MALTGGGFNRKSKASSEIPSSSLADMAFLLLIFFMVSTTFPKEKPRNLEFPEAEATEKLETPRRDIMHIFLEKDGRVFINDALIPIDRISDIVAPAYAESGQRLVPVLRSDRDVAYSFTDAVLKELQASGAVRVTFYTNVEERVRRSRR